MRPLRMGILTLAAAVFAGVVLVEKPPGTAVVQTAPNWYSLSGSGGAKLNGSGVDIAIVAFRHQGREGLPTLLGRVVDDPVDIALDQER